MNNFTEKRVNYRRYEDRRLAMLFAIYEILFDTEAGKARDEKILQAIAVNFKVDRAAFLAFDEGGNGDARMVARAGDFSTNGDAPVLGQGFERLLSLHREAVGALCLESVKKPEAFSKKAWESLWGEGMRGSVRALMSVEIKPKKHSRRLIWLQHTSSSREWSSRDRELIETLSDLLARASDKDA